jgi:hypothetical protein
LLAASYSPSFATSYSPSLAASYSPSLAASYSPSLAASYSPSLTASYSPSLAASYSPSLAASYSPSLAASYSPSLAASYSPSLAASLSPVTGRRFFASRPNLSQEVVPLLLKKKVSVEVTCLLQDQWERCATAVTRSPTVAHHQQLLVHRQFVASRSLLFGHQRSLVHC